MTIIQNEGNNAWILRLTGPLTAGQGVGALRAVEDRFATRPGRHLVIDLSDVDYLDAAGVGELVRLHRRAISHGSGIILTGIRGKVAEVLSLTRLADQLKVAPSQEEALKKPRSPLAVKSGESSPALGPQALLASSSASMLHKNKSY